MTTRRWSQEKESDKDNLSPYIYHKILQMRTPNLLSSTRTCVFISQPFVFAIFFICCIAAWVLTHRMNTEELVTMLSQSTIILTPSGFRSSDFNMPCFILILYRAVNSYNPCYRQIHMSAFTQTHSSIHRA